MPRFKSLTAKFIFISAIVVLFLAIYVYAGFVFTRHMKGEASRVNHAGQLRFRSFKMAWLAQQITEGTTKSRSLREALVKGLRQEIAEFETTLAVLKNDKRHLDVRFAISSAESAQQFNRLVDEWNGTLKPTLLRVAELSAGASEKAARALVDDYGSRVEGYVAEINRYLKALETDYEGELARFDHLRIYVILMFMLVSVFIILFIRQSVVLPVRRVRSAASEIEKGNFDVKLDVKTGDEIGALSASVNQMAASLGIIFDEKTRFTRSAYALARATQDIMGELELRKLLQTIVDKARDIIGSRYAAIGILNSARNGYEHFIPSGMDSDTFDEMLKRHGLPAGKGLLGLLLQEGRPLRVKDISMHAASVGFPEGHPAMRTFLGAPVLLRDTVLGRLYFTEKEGGGEFTPNDEHLAVTFAAAAALAIHNARMVAEARSHAQELLALNEASNALIGTTKKADIYKAVCEQAWKLFELRLVWLGIAKEEDHRVQPVAHEGYDEGYLSRITAAWDDSPEGRGPAGMSIKTGKPYLLKVDDPAFGPGSAEAKKRGYAVMLGVPLICSRRQCLGALLLYSGNADYFTPDKIQLCQVFANQAATALENTRLVDGLEAEIAERTRELEDANLELSSINRELEMRRTEAEGAKLAAESANRAKSDFLANMSHELRTPLNAILGFSELMIKKMAGELTAKQTEYLNDIHESGSLLLSLINDILDLSKVEANKVELEYEKIPVKDLVDRVLLLFKEKTMKHGIQLTAEYDDIIDDIEVDDRRIKQVLLNLVSNAVKFTNDGGSVVVRVRKMEGEKRTGLDHDDPGFVEFSVEDTGPGIRAEDIPTLFLPFHQLESTYEKKHQGTGLGLALCKTLVELHGGRIWIESEFGKGSTFAFVVPKTAPKRKSACLFRY